MLRMERSDVPVSSEELAHVECQQKGITYPEPSFQHCPGCTIDVLARNSNGPVLT